MPNGGQMGQVVSQTWYIYGRSYDQCWLPEPIVSTLCKADDLQYHIGRFKHTVYKLCLGHLENVCKVYLYQGWRVAKAERHETYVKVTFRDKTTAAVWDACDEVPFDGRKLSADFSSHYTSEANNDNVTRRFTPREPHQWTI